MSRVAYIAEDRAHRRTRGATLASTPSKKAAELDGTMMPHRLAEHFARSDVERSVGKVAPCAFYVQANFPIQATKRSAGGASLG